MIQKGLAFAVEGRMNRVDVPWSFRGRRVWAAIGPAAITAAFVLSFIQTPLLHGQSQTASGATSLSFDVVSIKPFRTPGGMTGCMFMPGRLTCKDTMVKWVILRAYNMLRIQLPGGPGWISSEPYDIEAKESDELSAEMEKLPREQRQEKERLLLRAMLADRFHLKVHLETREVPVYALVVAKSGPKLKAANVQSAFPGVTTGPDGRSITYTCSIGNASGGGDVYQNCTIATLAIFLPVQVGRIVLDQTGLQGRYDFTLNYAEQDSAADSSGAAGSGAASDNPLPPASSGPSIFTALQEQLGLKLESTRGPVDIIIIDHIERPTEN